MRLEETATEQRSQQALYQNRKTFLTRTQNRRRTLSADPHHRIRPFVSSCRTQRSRITWEVIQLAEPLAISQPAVTLLSSALPVAAVTAILREYRNRMKTLFPVECGHVLYVCAKSEPCRAKRANLAHLLSARGALHPRCVSSRGRVGS